MNEQITPSSTPLRTTLWAVLVISAMSNSVASAAAAGLVVHIALGAVTFGAAAALVRLWAKQTRA